MVTLLLVDCKQPHTAFDIALSCLMMAAIVLSYLPQYFKIASTGSSQGISPWYMLLGSGASCANLFNALLLQAPYFACCLSVVPGGLAC